MFEFLVYLAQSAICLATLYLIYKVAMSYETLHSFNRVLLLGSVVLSALLPLCHVRIVKEYDAAPTVSAIEIDDMVVAQVAELGVDYIALLKDVKIFVKFILKELSHHLLENVYLILILMVERLLLLQIQMVYFHHNYICYICHVLYHF